MSMNPYVRLWGVWHFPAVLRSAIVAPPSVS